MNMGLEVGRLGNFLMVICEGKVGAGELGGRREGVVGAW